MATQARAVATYKISNTGHRLECLLGASAEVVISNPAPITYAPKDITKARTVLDRLMQELEGAEVSYTRIQPAYIEEEDTYEG